MNINTTEEYFRDIVIEWCRYCGISCDFEYYDFPIEMEQDIIAFAYQNEHEGVLVSMYDSWEEIFDCLFSHKIKNYDENLLPFSNHEKAFLINYYKREENYGK